MGSGINQTAKKSKIREIPRNLRDFKGDLPLKKLEFEVNRMGNPGADPTGNYSIKYSQKIRGDSAKIPRVLSNFPHIPARQRTENSAWEWDP